MNAKIPLYCVAGLMVPRVLRAIRRAYRAHRLTSEVGREAEAMEGRLAECRLNWGWAEDYVPYEVTDEEQTASASIIALDEDDNPIELHPDPPRADELSLAIPSRRARLFAQYWVGRVHERYPRVIGDWKEASLACTRIFLCKAMRENREYYVWRTVDGERQLVRKMRRGYHTHQIAACVDWIVTLAHRGSPSQQAQIKLREQVRPNWIMRLLGLGNSVAVW